MEELWRNIGGSRWIDALKKILVPAETPMAECYRVTSPTVCSVVAHRRS
jgi:hypothetical protein